MDPALTMEYAERTSGSKTSLEVKFLAVFWFLAIFFSGFSVSKRPLRPPDCNM